MTTKRMKIPAGVCDFGCDGFVELMPARESFAPTPTPARAPAPVLREGTIRQQEILAEPARSREDAILDAAMLPEQGELAAELIASGLELEEAEAFLTLDLLVMFEQLEQLQSSGQ